MKHVIVEGASTAYGMGSERTGGWATLLKMDRESTNTAFPANPEILFNAALPGQTMVGINGRFNAVTDAGAAKYSDAMVRILGVGINEAKICEGQDTQFISSERFSNELGIYTDRCSKIGAMVILLGIQPINERLTRPMQVSQATLTIDATHRYDAVLRQHAAETDALYINTDMHYGLSGFQKHELISNDGYHPNDLGHKAIHRSLQLPLERLGFISSQPDLTPIR